MGKQSVAVHCPKHKQASFNTMICRHPNTLCRVAPYHDVQATHGEEALNSTPLLLSNSHPTFGRSTSTVTSDSERHAPQMRMDKLGPVALEHHANILYSRISRYNDLTLRRVKTLNLVTQAPCGCMLACGPPGSDFCSRILIGIAQEGSLARVLGRVPSLLSQFCLRILIESFEEIL